MVKRKGEGVLFTRLLCGVMKLCGPLVKLRSGRARVGTFIVWMSRVEMERN
jgi:hypothetical protein